MSREAGDYNKVTRVKAGGIHAYIGKRAIEDALTYAGMDPATADLKIKAHPMRTGRKNMARIILEIRLPEDPRR